MVSTSGRTDLDLVLDKVKVGELVVGKAEVIEAEVGKVEVIEAEVGKVEMFVFVAIGVDRVKIADPSGSIRLASSYVLSLMCTDQKQRIDRN